jgi:hypothetical protein
MFFSLTVAKAKARVDQKSQKVVMGLRHDQIKCVVKSKSFLYWKGCTSGVSKTSSLGSNLFDGELPASMAATTRENEWTVDAAAVANFARIYLALCQHIICPDAG